MDENLKKQEVEFPRYKEEVLEAMEEAKRISRDPNIKGYSSLSEALKVLDEDKNIG